MEMKKTNVTLVLMFAFVLLLTTPKTTTANQNLVIPLSEIIMLSNPNLAGAQMSQLSCRNKGEKCGPLYWCCGSMNCLPNIIEGILQCY
ncbi:hypothetical protein GPK61_13065 [Dorea formicigenerans]|nr:hypothetical protein [Dorea formicigenerans]